MAKKKTAAKKAAKGVTVVKEIPVVEEAPTYHGPMLRTLAAGSTVFLPGSETPLRLETDVQVLGDGIGKDRKWVGMLARDAVNWDLNIGSVEGTWSPVTCTRQEDPEPVAEEDFQGA